MLDKLSIVSYHTTLLTWYKQFHRHLPWRAHLNQRPDPYHVWLSEIMLQQTTVPTVIQYYTQFLKKWPTVTTLAHATLDDVLHAWQGLGYYSRAKNLHKTAGLIVQDYGGHFPQVYQTLLTLPGVGPYTAAAISSIAFDTPATVVDGNVERVMSRLFTIKTPLPAAKKSIYQHATQLTPHDESGHYAQALMDLGSMICTPTSPKCAQCPITQYCQAYQERVICPPATYPLRQKKTPLPEKVATVYWLINKKGAVLIEKRPPQGLLANLMAFPSTSWESLHQKNYKPDLTPLGKDVQIHHTAKTPVRHTFTHFKLFLYVVIAETRADTIPPALQSGHALWCDPSHFHTHAFPTLMKKVMVYVNTLTKYGDYVRL